MSGAKKRPLADVLWEAANVWLWPGRPPLDCCRHEQWSCHAVARAGGKSLLSMEPRSTTSCAERDFLLSLGCAYDADSVWQMSDWSTSQAQGVRYMWLLLAMHVAEDEGITV